MASITRRTSLKPTHFSDSISPLLQRIYSARGVTADEQVDYSLSHLHKPDSLKGLPAAVALLVEAVTQQKKVLIVGDFDADGATSCALSVLALRAMGLNQVDYLVPNRFEYGYGLSPEIVELASAQAPDIIMTVDNGIASIEGVERTTVLGIQVIITDHHLPPSTLPVADAIVNPNQLGCCFASKNLAGVGVTFYVLSALRAALRAVAWFNKSNIAEPNMADYLDLVALGTVADLVPLDGNNRTLVYQGIQRIRAGRARPGILALLEIAGKDYPSVKTSDLGFVVGPRLNAAGRLDDMSVGIQCLISGDSAQARQLAYQLDNLNKDRRAIENAMRNEAVNLVQQLALEQQPLPWGLCLFEQGWHQGVVGLVASRIKDKYHRPVIAFAEVDDETLKGSARSVPALHIRDTLDVLATTYPDILQKFGGHAMAAGMTILKKDFQRFAECFDQLVRQRLSAKDLNQTIHTDGELTIDDLNLAAAYQLESAGPWGQDFPEPAFDGVFSVISYRVVGDKHIKLVLAHPDSPQLVIDAIAFNADLGLWAEAEVQMISVVYQLSPNEYRGKKSLQLIISHLEALGV
ncbi:MAG: single-stranded-DNA-specific exonuclease RecJ [Pseudomonadota bacterium]